MSSYQTRRRHIQERSLFHIAVKTPAIAIFSVIHIIKKIKLNKCNEQYSKISFNFFLYLQNTILDNLARRFQ
jgi:hypothetical protein